MQMQADRVPFDAVQVSSDEIVELFAMQALLGTWRFEVDGELGLISRNICSILAFSADSDVVSIDAIMKYVHPDDNAMLHDCFAQAIKSGSSMECLYRIVRPEGDAKKVRVVGRVRLNENGRREIYGATYEVQSAIRYIGYVD